MPHRFGHEPKKPRDPNNPQIITTKASYKFNGLKLMFEHQKIGMNREDFAKRLGIGKSTLAFFETGEKAPALPLLLKISEVLNIPASDFLLNYDALKELDPNVWKQIEESPAMQDRKRLMLIGLNATNRIPDVDKHRAKDDVACSVDLCSDTVRKIKILAVQKDVETEDVLRSLIDCSLNEWEDRNTVISLVCAGNTKPLSVGAAASTAPDDADEDNTEIQQVIPRNDTSDTKMNFTKTRTVKFDKPSDESLALFNNDNWNLA